MDEPGVPDYDYIQWDRPGGADQRASSTPDLSKISLLSERELRYWTDLLRVTMYELRDALKATGSNDPVVVRDYIGAHG